MVDDVLTEKLTQIREEKIRELTTIRTLIFRYAFRKEDEDFLLRYMPVLLYSVWEGYVKDSLSEYFRAINALKLHTKQLNVDLKTYYFYSSGLGMKNTRQNREKQKIFIAKLEEALSEEVVFPTTVNTGGNLDYKNTNSLLQSLGLHPLSKAYKGDFNKFINFRNDAAHGDANPMKRKELDQFCTLVNELIYEVFTVIYEGYQNQSYLRN